MLENYVGETIYAGKYSIDTRGKIFDRGTIC